LLDRIDVQVEVPVVPAEVLAAAPEGDASARVAERVARARSLQWQRQACLNADLSADGLQAHGGLQAAAARLLQQACTRFAWSGRGYFRVFRLARTLADLAGSEGVEPGHVAEAIQYRRALAGERMAA
jgi:magnesium chelatase family protein